MKTDHRLLRGRGLSAASRSRPSGTVSHRMGDGWGEGALNLHPRKSPSIRTSPVSTQDGSAVMVVFMVMAILMILVVSNSRTVLSLSSELRLVEKRQISHWAGTRTNKTVRVIQPAPQPQEAAP